MIVDNYGTLENSTDFTNLVVDDFRISMETAGGDASCRNVTNEIHNRSIHNMGRSVLLEIKEHENKC